MLSVSADITKSRVDLRLVNGDETALAGDILHGVVLMKFAEAVANRNEQALSQAREQLLQQAGAQVLVDAAAVAANFQRMVRIADSTGIPLDELSAAVSVGVRKALNLARFTSAHNTPKGGVKQKLMNLIARPLARRMFKKMSKQ
jgi:hypothetical protein